MNEFDPVECEHRYGEIKIRLTEMSGDISHIKGRIDNGMSVSIAEILKKVNEICPIVNDNKKWVGQIKWAVIWITVITVGGGLAAISFSLVKKLLGL